MEKINRIRGIIYAFISSGTFGLIPLFSIPLMVNVKMQETSILFYRYLFSALLIGSLCLIEKKNILISLNTLFRIFILSIFSIYTASALIYSYNYIPSGTATTIHFLYPILVALLMITFYKEKASLKLIITTLVSLVGVGFLSWTDQGFMSMKGLLIAFTTAITYAVYITGLNQKGVNKTDSKVITLYIMSFGAVFLGIFSLLTTGIDGISGTKSWFNLIMLALVPTVISNISLVQAVKYAGATTTSILGSAEPVTAIIIGILLFSESFTVYSFIGLILIITSVSYVVISNTRKNKIH